MQSIFVSSTFKDMMAERDMMQSLVLPELRDFARKFGQSLNIIDLRWGVNTEDMDTESGVKQVLSVCLNEIDRCQPYIVVFLGERYGWCPPLSIFKESVPETILSACADSLSVTALEIEYGALMEGRDITKCLFYFREPLPSEALSSESKSIYFENDAEHEVMMLNLKKRIEASGARVFRYRTEWDAQHNRITLPDSLASKVAKDLEELLEPQYIEFQYKSEHEKAEAAFLQTVEEKVGRFRARSDLAAEYIAEIRKKSCPVFGIYGYTGSGKSTMISYLATELRSYGTVIPFICGNSSLYATVGSIPRFVLFKLMSLLGDEFQDDKSLSNASVKALLIEKAVLWEKEKRGQIYVLIDGAELFDKPGKILYWTGEMLPDCITVIYSWMLQAGQALPKTPKGQVVRLLPPLDNQQQLQVIDGVSQYKKMYSSVIECILAKEECANPLYLSLLTQRLVWMDSEDFSAYDNVGLSPEQTIIHDMIHIVETQPSSLAAISIAFLTELASRVSMPSAAQAFALIAVSRYGLREEDIVGALRQSCSRFDSLAFSRLRKYMMGFFTERPDGRIDYTHRAFRDGILQNTDDKAVCHKSIFLWLRQSPDKDPIKQSEVLYHAWLCGNRNYLVRFFSRACDNAAACAKAAATLFTICEQDNLKWLSECLAAEPIDTNCLYAMLGAACNDKFKNVSPALRAGFWKLLAESADKHRANIVAINIAEAYQQSASAYLEAGEFAEARRLIEIAERRHMPSKEDELLNRGNCIIIACRIDMAQKNPDMAADRLTRFADAHGNAKLPAYYYEELIEVQLALRRLSDAEETVAQYIANAPEKSIQRMNHAAKAFISAGYSNQAILLYERIAREQSTGGIETVEQKAMLMSTYNKLFKLCYDCGNWRKALSVGALLSPLIFELLELRPCAYFRRILVDFCHDYMFVLLTYLKLGKILEVLIRKRAFEKSLIDRTQEKNMKSIRIASSVLLIALIAGLAALATLPVCAVIAMHQRELPFYMYAVIIGTPLVCFAMLVAAGSASRQRKRKKWRKMHELST